ncbi:MAG: AraC family transcriptional regulator [Lachnospiraceae bacterium]|nr:AraC family transcriptional regulator [Lachnospiraceae bacterium]
MEWWKNLNAAIAYIEDNLDNELSYEEAARAAYCSPCYFQRIFSYVSGMSLSEYVRRRKMTQAAFELQRTDQTIMNIALKYGYSSPTAFNRAFRTVHGISPSAARAMGSNLQAYPRLSFNVSITGGTSLPYHIVQKPHFRIVGIRIPMSEDREENLKCVPDFWKSARQGSPFLDLCRLSREESRKILGVSVYENPREIYYYIGVVTDAPAPSGMYECKIPTASWAIFENDGHFKETVQNVFRRLPAEWLPFSGYTHAKLPDIEVYPICSRQALQGHSEVWIAVKKED